MAGAGYGERGVDLPGPSLSVSPLQHLDVLISSEAPELPSFRSFHYIDRIKSLAIGV